MDNISIMLQITGIMSIFKKKNNGGWLNGLSVHQAVFFVT